MEMQGFKNLVKLLFPTYFERKRVRLMNAVLGRDVKIYGEAYLVNTSQPRDHIRIDEATHIAGTLVVASNKGKISVGRNTFIGKGSQLIAVEEIRVGNYVQIGHNVNIFDSNIHSLNAIERQKEFYINTEEGFKQVHDLKESAVVIHDNAWIGAGSFILKGVSIGENSIVGAGSVVTSDIPANSIAAGNPAKIIRSIERNGQD